MKDIFINTLIYIFLLATLIFVYHEENINNKTIGGPLYSLLIIFIIKLIIVLYILINNWKKDYNIISFFLLKEEKIEANKLLTPLSFALKNLRNQIFNSKTIIDSWRKEVFGCFRDYWLDLKRNSEIALDYAHYIPVNIKLDNQEVLLDDRSVKDIISMFSKKGQSNLTILGEGGGGKTAFAINIINTILEKNDFFLPVKIDSASIKCGIELNAAILNSIRGVLNQKNTVKFSVNEQFLQTLIKQGRLVMLIDDVDKVFKNLSSESTLFMNINSNANMIYTSRNDVSKKKYISQYPNKKLVKIKNLTLSSAHDFVKAYFTKKYQISIDKRINGESLYDEVSNTLSAFTSIDNGISPTLLTIWVDEIHLQIKKGKGLSGISKAKLIERYFIRLGNKQHKQGALPRADFFALSKRLAYLSIFKTLKTTGLTRNDVLEEFKEIYPDEKPRDILKVLVDDFQVVDFVEYSDLISFRLDIIAEHLAAIYVFDTIVMDQDDGWEKCQQLITTYKEKKVSKNNFFYFLQEYLKKLKPTSGETINNFFRDEIGKELYPIGGTIIKIAIVSSLSGANSIRERSIHDALIMGVHEANEEFKKNKENYQIQITSPRDTNSNNDYARMIVKNAIDEHGVISVFGCWLSDMRQALESIMEDRDNLLWYSATYEGGGRSKRIIYLGGAPNQQIVPAVNWSKKNMGKKVALFGSDYIFSKKAHELIKKELRVVKEFTFDKQRRTSKTDFKKFIKQAKKGGAKWIFHSINNNDNMAFFQALKEINSISKTNIKVMTVSIAESMIDHIGADLLAGHFCCWNYFASQTDKQNIDFKSALEAKYLKTIKSDDPVVCAYMSIKIFAEAVRTARSLTPNGILSATKKIERLDGPGGDWCIDEETQHFIKSWYIGTFSSEGSVDIIDRSKGTILPNPNLTID